MSTPITFVRTVLTYQTDANGFAWSLDRFAKENINLQSSTTVKVNEWEKCYLVKVIPGFADLPQTPEQIASYEETVEKAKKVLDKLRLEFNVSYSVQVLNIQSTPTPGAVRNFNNRIYCRFDIVSKLDGEPSQNPPEITSIYFETRSIYEARALSEFVSSPLFFESPFCELECPITNCEVCDKKDTYKIQEKHSDKKRRCHCHERR